jgi:hypothetical protein
MLPASRGQVEPIVAGRYKQKSALFIHKPVMFLAIDNAIAAAFPNTTITEVVSGKAEGGDHFGELWAVHNRIRVKEFPVKPEEWKMLGGLAGMVRNRKMGDYVARTMDTVGAGVLAIHDGVSRGTLNMLDYGLELGIRCVVIELNNGELKYRVLG